VGVIVAVVIALVGVLAGHMTAGKANAQGRGGGNPTLEAIQNLQNQISNGVSCKVRQYYLTQNTFRANSALTACEAGFHMASLWEIYDTTNLEYDTTRGKIREDAGTGPPSNDDDAGWIRTGNHTAPADRAGYANCDNWTSLEGTGTAVALGEGHWGREFLASPIGPWEARVNSCNSLNHVWCIAD
jgi:hypothetical protein